jgi:hypothetical protein
MGGLYLANDILGLVRDGKMQMFADGESIAVTQIAAFPRARMLEVLAAVGDLEACRKLHDRILQFANDQDISLVQAYGRRGWIADAESRGWKVRTTSYLYQREL